MSQQRSAPTSPLVRVPPERPGPAGGRRDTNRMEKAQALQNAALELFLERGIEATTIDEITRSAGVAKGSFYRYFEDKTALVASLFAGMHQAMETVFASAADALNAADGREQLQAAYGGLSTELTGVLFAHLPQVRLYLQEARGPAEGARIPVRRLADYVAEQALSLSQVAHDRRLLREVDPRVTSLTVVGAVERLLFAILTGEDVGDPLAAALALVDLVLEGCRVR